MQIYWKMTYLFSPSEHLLFINFAIVEFLDQVKQEGGPRCTVVNNTKKKKVMNFWFLYARNLNRKS